MLYLAIWIALIPLVAVIEGATTPPGAGVSPKRLIGCALWPLALAVVLAFLVCGVLWRLALAIPYRLGADIRNAYIARIAAALPEPPLPKGPPELKPDAAVSGPGAGTSDGASG